MGRPGGPGPLDPIFDVDTIFGFISFDNTPGSSPLTVTINQGSGQSDPTSTSPIVFDVVFSEAVTGFATGDVTLTGSAGGTLVGTVSGAGTTYTVSVTGMTTAGSVIASIAANKCVAVASGIPNRASTSTDNTVIWETFVPSDITGLLLWLDAADAATIVTVGPNAVSEWHDKSGNARHMTDQGDVNLRPNTGIRTQNTLNVIDFSGSDGLARFGPAFWYNAGPSTMFVVYQIDTDPGAPSSFLGTLVFEPNYSGNGEFGLRYDVDNLNPVLVSDTNSIRFNFFGDDPTGAIPHWATWIDTTTNISIAQDGGTPSSTAYTRTTSSANVFNVGMNYSNSFPAGGRFMDGWLAEIIIYDSVLSAPDIALVEAYIQDKWGI